MINYTLEFDETNLLLDCFWQLLQLNQKVLDKNPVLEEIIIRNEYKVEFAIRYQNQKTFLLTEHNAYCNKELKNTTPHEIVDTIYKNLFLHGKHYYLNQYFIDVEKEKPIIIKPNETKTEVAKKILKPEFFKFFYEKEYFENLIEKSIINKKQNKI